LGAFGEKLRKQREQRGIELEKISNTTKISTRMLRALEEEHFDQLPGGVFNKGFVRAYARQVGLDAEEAVNDYLAALRESQVQSQSILPAFRKPVEVTAAAPSQPKRGSGNPESPEPKTGEGGGGDLGHNNVNSLKVDHQQNSRDEVRSNVVIRAAHKKEDVLQPDRPAMPIRTGALPEMQPESPGSPGIPWGKLAAALLAVSAVLAFWNLRRQNQPTDPSSHPVSNQVSASAASPQPSVPSQPPATSPSKLDQPKLEQTKTDGRKTEPTKTESTKTESTKTEPTKANQTAPPPGELSPPVSTHVSATVPEAAAVASTKSATASAESAPTPDSNPPTPKALVHKPAMKAPSSFTLLIRADKTSWVSILADGKLVAEETLIAPAHTSVRATREISIKTRNAGGISFLMNGKEIPAHGVDGEVGLFIFDAQGMKGSEVQSPTSAP
jgi:cytoskeletal protein RodZ